jgi:hypothetical protein
MWFQSFTLVLLYLWFKSVPCFPSMPNSLRSIPWVSPHASLHQISFTLFRSRWKPWSDLRWEKTTTAAGSHPHHRGWRRTMPPIFRDLPRPPSSCSSSRSWPLTQNRRFKLQASASETFILSLLRRPGQEVTLFLSTGTNGQGAPAAAADELRLSFVKTTLICAACGTAGSHILT